MNELFLGLMSFFTSIITGVVGFGGGLLLIAILPSFLPLNALIPVHGLTQISSNISRAYLGYKDIQYNVVLKYCAGSFIGIGIFALLLNLISVKYIPLFIGTYILLSLWSQTFSDKIKKYESYYVIGFFQTGLSVIVGATGPLAIPKLLKDFEDNDKVVATAAVFMGISHILKVLVFLNFGFVFSAYLSVIISMITGSILGSFVGTKLRQKINGKKLIFALKILLSILAIKSIITII